MQRKFCLLLVDDEETGSRMLNRRLEHEGYVVAAAENGGQALEMMRVERFDLVLLDVYMPVLDGVATLDAIKSDPLLQDATVIMLTAANNREHVVHCLSLGAADYLVKPVNPAELVQRVRNSLEKKGPRIEPTVQLTTVNMEGLRVLVVDDEPLNLKLLDFRLTQLGFQTVAVQTGREALGRLENDPVDAVLLDVNMADMSGMDVLQAIRGDDRRRLLPVLMLSADGEQGTISRCYEIGANDYLTKPYHLHDLKLRLAVALDIAAAHKECAGAAHPVV